MWQVAGCLILVVFGALFYFFSASAHKSKRASSIELYLLNGRRSSCGLIAASALVSWTWTTTIIGAAEAGALYGVSGGLSYSIGAACPFLLFIPLILRLRKVMPEGISYTEFIGVRYGSRMKDLYFLFAVLVVVYVFLEQLVGVAMVFQNVFGLPFKLTVALVALLVTAYIIRGGTSGALRNNVFHFFVIFVLLGAVFILLTKNMGIRFLYDGLVEASADGENPNYNPDALILSSAKGFQYGLIAFVVAHGQVLLDQGYYLIAMTARSRKALLWGFVLGAIAAWMPISIFCANSFGHGTIALRGNLTQNVAEGVDIATSILKSAGSFGLLIAFAIMIFLIGVSTGGNCLIGVLSVFSVDFYGSKLRPDANDFEKIRFGRIMTVCIAALCAFIAIALEGISLLRIDMFSGIFFAAPCGPLILGVFTRYAGQTIPLLATVTGLMSGILTWAHMGFSSESWLYGCLLSFLTPFVIMLVTFPFTRERFNFAKLKFYKP